MVGVLIRNIQIKSATTEMRIVICSMVLTNDTKIVSLIQLKAVMMSLILLPLFGDQLPETLDLLRRHFFVPKECIQHGEQLLR